MFIYLPIYFHQNVSCSKCNEKSYLITFLSMPSSVANTFPRKITFAVHTSWVSHTFITGWTCPTFFVAKQKTVKFQIALILINEFYQAFMIMVITYLCDTSMCLDVCNSHIVDDIRLCNWHVYRSFRDNQVCIYIPLVCRNIRFSSDNQEVVNSLCSFLLSTQDDIFEKKNNTSLD